MQVKVGPTRHDILHECDIIEDVGIAYGYLRIPHSIPKTLTTGAQVPSTAVIARSIIAHTYIFHLPLIKFYIQYVQYGVNLHYSNFLVRFEQAL